MDSKKQIVCLNNKGVEEFVSKLMAYQYEFKTIHNGDPVYAIYDNKGNLHYLNKDRFGVSYHNCPLLYFVKNN